MPDHIKYLHIILDTIKSIIRVIIILNVFYLRCHAVVFMTTWQQFVSMSYLYK